MTDARDLIVNEMFGRCVNALNMVNELQYLLERACNIGAPSEKMVFENNDALDKAKKLLSENKFPVKIWERKSDT